MRRFLRDLYRAPAPPMRIQMPSHSKTAAERREDARRAAAERRARRLRTALQVLIPVSAIAVVVGLYYAVLTFAAVAFAVFG